MHGKRYCIIILWSDGFWFAPAFFCGTLTADVRAWLETVEAVPRVSRTTDGERILCFHSTNCKMVLQCAPVVRACVVHSWCFCPFVRRTAVQISVCEELQDVRCGIAFFCAQTSMARCKATVGFDKRGRSTCCFASIARETRPGFLGLLRDIARRSFLTFFESL